MELCIHTTSQRPRVKIMTEEFFQYPHFIKPSDGFIG